MKIKEDKVSNKYPSKGKCLGFHEGNFKQVRFSVR